jgi:uncharacterized membrane protein YvbJ
VEFFAWERLNLVSALLFVGVFMAYCHNCGEKLAENALFCTKCGAKVVQAATGGASTPSEEVRDAFNKMSVELEKAFNVAAKELQEAFQAARSNIQKTIYKEPIVCPNCSEKNPASSTFCTKCGQSLSGARPSKPTEGN